MKLKSVAGVVGINILVLAGLVVGLLLIVAIVGDTYNFAKSLFPKQDRRAELSTYEDQEYAVQVFRDQKGSIKNYVPFIEWRQLARKTDTLNIDENGYRTHTAGGDNSPGATRIGFFGGSTMWGTGVDDNGTIAAQFDAITRNYEVVNYSERGFTTLQNFMDLIKLLNTQQAPQTVVFYEGFNDVWVHCDYAVTKLLNSHMEERRLQSAVDRSADENYLYNMVLVPVSFLTRVLTSKKDAAHEAACSNNPDRADAVAEMFVRTLEMAHTLVSASGGRFYAVLQPHGYYGSPRVDYLRLDGQRHDGQRTEFGVVYPLIIEKMAARGHEWFIDLSHALDGEDAFLIDFAHLTSKGNALIAELVRKSIN